jgi:hypothetical protein
LKIHFIKYFQEELVSGLRTGWLAGWLKFNPFAVFGAYLPL